MCDDDGKLFSCSDLDISHAPDGTICCPQCSYAMRDLLLIREGLGAIVGDIVFASRRVETAEDNPKSGSTY